jgi:hypothetical protein
VRSWAVAMAGETVNRFMAPWKIAAMRPPHPS